MTVTASSAGLQLEVETVNPSTFPIQNVKLRVKRKVELNNFYVLGLYRNAGNPGDYQRSVTCQ